MMYMKYWFFPQQPASVGAQADDADDEDLSAERWEEAAKLIELAVSITFC